MKITRKPLLLIVIVVFAMGGYAQPQLQRYLPSFTGTNSSVAPPDGFTLSVNQAIVSLNTYYDGSGNIIGDNLKVYVPVTLPVLIYVPKFKVLGATYSTLVIFPIMNVAPFLNDVDIDPSKIGVGNIFFQPIGLNWKFNNFFLSTAYGVHTPTGRYKPNANDNISRGFWTHQFSLGGTYFLGKNSFWNISAMNRFEFHGKVEGLDIYPGTNWTMDWGLGRAISKSWAVGITGYVARQLQFETGANAAKDKTKYASQGLGGEITWIPSKKVLVQMRAYQDVGTVINSPRKTFVMLTINWFINN